MTNGLLIPLPILLSLLAAGTLSPETNVPLGWVIAGFAASGALAWRAWRAHTKWMDAARTSRQRVGRLEKLAGDTAREVAALKKRLEEMQK